jgi:16S rRNA (adenine1518-N6/adenine1519-N6)-dimethyltransferase
MRAKKSYGQHFLREEPIAQRIAESLQLLDTYQDIVEIGPGTGMLTKYLLRYQPTHKLTVVEADAEMVEYLKTNLLTLPQEQIIKKDFLQVALDEQFENKQFGLIGNFPYNISSQIVFKTIEYKSQIPEMVGMFQREVAERIAASPDCGEYGILTVLVQAFYDAKLLFGVKPGSFNPPPKVQSAVIRLTRKENQNLGCDEKLFKITVKQAFAQRRKMMRNTLAGLLSKEILYSDDNFTKRAENFSVSDFVQLTNQITEFRKSEKDAHNS